MKILLFLLFLLSFSLSCKIKSKSQRNMEEVPAAASIKSEVYSPKGNNLDLAGATAQPLLAIDADQLQVDQLQVTLTPYKSGKDVYNTLMFQVKGKFTDNSNLVSDYLQYKVCMKQNGAGGQSCLCHNGIDICPYQDDSTGTAGSAIYNEFSTGDYRVPDPYTTNWEVPLPAPLSGVLSSTVRLCVRDSRKTAAENCGPWATPILNHLSGAYVQSIGQVKQTIQQLSTQEGDLAFSLVQSATTYQKAFSGISSEDLNNEERALALYASNFIAFPDYTRQVLQNSDLYQQLVQQAQDPTSTSPSTSTDVGMGLATSGTTTMLTFGAGIGVAVIGAVVLYKGVTASPSGFDAIGEVITTKQPSWLENYGSLGGVFHGCSKSAENKNHKSTKEVFTFIRVI